MVKYSREPMAASREPMMKVTEITLLIRMPMSCAVSKSRDTARMAIPIRVWLMSWVRAATRSTTSTGVTTVTYLVDTPAMVSWLDRPGRAGYIWGRPPVT